MNRKLWVLSALVFGQFLSDPDAVSAAPRSSAPAAKSEKGDTGKQAPLDEVIIDARKESLGDLRAQLERSEDAFYEAFSKVVTKPEYATHCGLRSRMDSHILDRVCTPQFVDTATATEAEAFLEGRAGLSATDVIMEKWPAYKAELLTLTRSDPKLRKMAHDYDELRKHYESVRKEKHKGKWFVLD